MGRVSLAFKAFFRVLADQAAADLVGRALGGRAAIDAPAAPAPVPVPAPSVKPHATARSDALNLLAVLQREARFIDFFKEEIAGYADAQIGASVRDVHRDTAAALERIFALRPAAGEAEGSAVDVPAGYDAGRLRLTGNVAGPPPHRGTLRHAGWEATKLQLPEWGGTERSARVVAPAEVEL